MMVYDKGGDHVIFIIYVDDILVTRNNNPMIQFIVNNLNSVFHPKKNLGTLSYFLGIEVSKTSDCYHLCQAKYITQLLDKVQLSESEPASTLMKSGNILSKTDGKPLVDATMYRLAIETLQYCTLIKPDISYVVKKLY